MIFLVCNLRLLIRFVVHICVLVENLVSFGLDRNSLQGINLIWFDLDWAQLGLDWIGMKN